MIGEAIARYKLWVRHHPGIVQNLDWLLYLTVWNPARTSASGGPSEVQYESYHACIGLLSVWHQHLIEEDELPVKKPAAALWMEALEQVETIIELRSMHLESVGKMSRYAPLVALESVKSLLKMLMWSQYAGHLYLRHPTPEDVAHFEAEQGFQDVLSALERLRTRYTTLSDCSSAAATDLMSHLTAVAQPLQRLLGRGGAHMATRASIGVTHTNQSSSKQQQQQQRQREGGDVSGGDGGGSGNNGDSGGGDEGGSGSQGAGCIIDWSRVPGLDERGTAQGSAAVSAAWDVEAWQRDSLRQIAEDREGREQLPRQSFDFKRQGAGYAGAGSAEAMAAATAASKRRGKSCAAGEQQQQQHEKQQQGPGTAHVFSDERAGMNLIWLGEMLHIWRPVLYVWMLYRYGRRSWRPWWTSLALDLLSGHFSRRGRTLLQQRVAKGGGSKSAPTTPEKHAPTSLLSVALVRGLSTQQWSLGEVRELSERRRKLAMYALRSPFYNSFIKPPSEAVQRRTAHVPLLGACTDYVAGLLDTFTKYYTYTSASS